ncbi:MAG TPA: NAD(P)-binding domain-containing protein [Rhizomicrobium sp.]
MKSSSASACEVAIIGAGPYGLSLAAHLNAKGIDCRVFGKPLSTWNAHMPRNMFLKSDGFASNLSAPFPESTLGAFCAVGRIAYAPQGFPIALDTFLEYADSFCRRFVPRIDKSDVSSLTQDADGFRLALDDGRTLAARNVVVATGITHFAYTPAPLGALPEGAVSHSFDHRKADKFLGRDVAVVGAGSSATDTAIMLHDAGVSVRIVARAPAIEYNSIPDPDADSLLYRIQRPASGIGRGWRSYFCASAPLLFHKLPEPMRRRAIMSHMHPAAGWFMQEGIEGRVPCLLGRQIAEAKESGGRVLLTLKDSSGSVEVLACDHVIAATGYRPDIRKLSFLSRDLCDLIAPARTTAPLTDRFETRVPGLFVIGPAAIDSFGPLMRFMYGAEFAAPHLAAFLERKLSAASRQQAAWAQNANGNGKSVRTVRAGERGEAEATGRGRPHYGVKPVRNSAPTHATSVCD